MFEITENVKKLGECLKEITILLIISIVLFNLIIILPKPLTITSPTDALRFDKITNLTYSDASFVGESANDYAGILIAGGGNVNGNGYSIC